MSVKSNLVILPNSPYSDWIIDRSERVAAGKNDYVCFSENKNLIKSNLCQHRVFAGAEFYSFCLKAEAYKRVIIHYHNMITAHFLAKSNLSSAKAIWVLWSGDLYNSDFYKKPLYQSLTAKFVGSSRISKSPIWWTKEIVKYFLNRAGHYQLKKSFKNIKYIASPFEKDVEEASHTFKKSFSHLPFAFLSVKEMFDEEFFKMETSVGSKLMIGHSGMPENNHLDIFNKLSYFSFSNFIFCPLSYGNSAYISIVESRGKEIFGDQFEAFKSFLPKKEYYQKLSEVGFAIFNTNVQKGFGNILGLLYLGVKVFLRKENSVYFQMKKWGILVRAIDEINSQELSTPLNEEEIERNRVNILRLFNNQKLDQYYSNLYNFTLAEN